MTYRLDKRYTRRKPSQLRWVLFAVLIGTLFVFLGWPLIQKADRLVSGIAVPLYRLTTTISEEHDIAPYMMRSKTDLAEEIITLKERLAAQEGQAQQLDAITREYEALRYSIGEATAEEENLLLAEIIARPGQSAYGTLLVDRGTTDGIVVDMPVIAHRSVLIGFVQDVAPHSSVIRLLSMPGHTTDALVATEATAEDVLPISLRGEGAGTMSFTTPRDIALTEEAPVTMPGYSTYPIGQIGQILFDEQDPTKEALVRLGANVQSLRWVEIITTEN